VSADPFSIMALIGVPCRPTKRRNEKKQLRENTDVYAQRLTYTDDMRNIVDAVTSYVVADVMETEEEATLCDLRTDICCSL